MNTQTKLTDWFKILLANGLDLVMDNPTHWRVISEANPDVVIFETEDYGALCAFIAGLQHATDSQKY